MQRKTKIKVAITSVGLAMITIGTGIFSWVLKSKYDEVQSYIPSSYSFKGSLLKKDNPVTDEIMKESNFLIIEVPNFRESLYEYDTYVNNIVECKNNDMPCALYQRTCAKNNAEIDIEVALLKSLADKNNNCYDVYIDIMDVIDKISKENLVNYISYFKKQLYYKDMRTVFSMTKDIYDNIKNYLDDDIEILLQTQNKDFDNKKLDSYMVSRDVWDRNFDEAEYGSNKPMTIYKDQNYPGISESERETIGIDISEHQGDIDFDLLKDNVGYTIIRWADAYVYNKEGQIDSKFDQFITGCDEANIKYGVYIFSRATNEKEGIEEAEALCNDLMVKKIDPKLPVFIDVESHDNYIIRQLLDNKDVNLLKAVEGFCNTVKEKGFNPGIYMCESEMLELKQIAEDNNSNLFDDTILWVANWGDNPNVTHSTIKNYQFPTIDEQLHNNTYIQQGTENGTIPGVEEKVDYNILIKKLP